MGASHSTGVRRFAPSRMGEQILGILAGQSRQAAGSLFLVLGQQSSAPYEMHGCHSHPCLLTVSCQGLEHRMSLLSTSLSSEPMGGSSTHLLNTWLG